MMLFGELSRSVVRTADCAGKRGPLADFSVPVYRHKSFKERN